jgi:hypothetical protein
MMQKQLASSLTMVVPKYAKRPKATPGSGHGCGSPPRLQLPPLWMYSMGKKRTHSTAPPRHIGKLRSRQHKSGNKYPFNKADELGTHRYYIQH